MSDLDKLMKKLKETPTDKAKVKDLPVVPTPITETPQEDPDEDLEDDFDDLEETPTPAKKVEESEPKQEIEEHEQTIESEVAVLQNDGVFRRELLLTLKELVEVHKANTQTLIDIKKLVEGANAKE